MAANQMLMGLARQVRDCLSSLGDRSIKVTERLNARETCMFAMARACVACEKEARKNKR